MKVSKQNDKLKNHHNGCDHFWNGFECFTNSLVHQTTHHDWVVGHNHGVAHLQWSTTNTQQRDGKHQSMNHKKDKETKEWRVWLFFLLKTPLSTLQSLSWLSLHSLSTTLSPLSMVIPWMGKPTQVWWVCCFWEPPDDGCLDGVDEPQWATSQPQHPPCVPSCFSHCAFHSHPHPTNGVHVIVSPIVCTTIQPMSCVIHPSLQLNHTLTLASHTTWCFCYWHVFCKMGQKEEWVLVELKWQNICKSNSSFRPHLKHYGMWSEPLLCFMNKTSFDIKSQE